MQGSHKSRSVAVAAIFLIAGVASRRAESAPLAYITNSYSRTVWVIDTADGMVVAVIPIEASPWGVAVHPDGKRVYVTLPDSNALALIDATTRQVGKTVPLPISPADGRAAVAGTALVPTLPPPTATIGNRSGPTPTATPSGPSPTSTPKRVGVAPVGVAVNPMRGQVYVATVGGISVLDEEANPVLSAPVPLASNDLSRLQGVVASPDGEELYVTVDNGYADAGALVALTSGDLAMVATVPVGVHPLGVAVSGDGRRIYVANSVSSTVSVIDAEAKTVITEIPVEPAPIAVATDSGGHRVYVSISGSYEQNNSAVAVIDASLNQVTTTIPVPFSAYGIDVSDDERLVVASGGANTLSTIDTATHAIVTSALTGRNAIAFGRFLGPPADPASTPTPTPTPAPRREYAYVLNTAGQSLSVVDAVTNRLVHLAPLGNVPREIAASPGGEYLYVYLDDAFGHTDLVELATDTLSPAGTVDVPPSVFSLAMSPDGTRLFVGGDNLISVVDTATNLVTASRALALRYDQSIAVSPDGATLYVTSGSSVQFRDSHTLASVGEVPLDHFAGRVVVAPDAARLYVGGGGVTVIDVQDRAVIDTFGWQFTPGDAYALEFGVSPDALTVVALVYRRFYRGPTVSSLDFIDTDTDKSLGETPAEVDPARVAFSRQTGRAYVTNRGANTISVVDLARRAIAETIPVGNGPEAIVLAPAPGGTLSPTVTVRPARTPTVTPTFTPDLCPDDLEIEPSFGHKGTPFVVRGHCGPDFLSASFDDVPLGYMRSAADGAYVGRFLVPLLTSAGQHPVKVYASSGRLASTRFFAVLPQCCGDCNGDDAVSSSELRDGVRVALGSLPRPLCRAADANNDGEVTISDLVRAVLGARHGCGACLID